MFFLDRSSLLETALRAALRAESHRSTGLSIWRPCGGRVAGVGRVLSRFASQTYCNIYSVTFHKELG